jgi:hypothetical protein
MGDNKDAVTRLSACPTKRVTGVALIPNRIDSVEFSSSPPFGLMILSHNETYRVADGNMLIDSLAQ